MFAKLRRVPPAAWALAALVAALSTFSVIAITNQVAPGGTVIYIIQPLAALLITTAAHLLSKGRQDRVRHTKDKAIIIGSVLAIWFVAYFATGIFLTYVHNALVGTAKGVLLNMIGFGVTAAAVEYTRHRALLLAGRRNLLWFGAIVTVVFAAQQMNLGHLATAGTPEDAIKLIVSDVVPSFVSSALLTYLAASSGLPAMMTYRLGIVAMAVLPPILPKFDWYLIGVSSILLAITVFLVIDRTQQSSHQPRTRHHVNRAIETTWLCTMVALILFMSGVLAYKPSAIMSNSMLPVFSRGSMVIVQKTGAKMDITVGDIIQYEAHGLVITHRVVAVDQSSDGTGGTTYTTKGDNNPSRDDPVDKSHVTGIVRAQIPYVGYPTVWLRELVSGNQSDKVNK